jgi:hypothetical protein
MNTVEEKSLSTADFAAAADRRPEMQAEREAQVARENAQRDEAAQRASDVDYREAASNREADARETVRSENEQLAALFPPDTSNDFRSRWDAVQIGFVDDPGQAVRRADELVAQVMKSLAESFAAERSRLEQQIKSDGGGSTENLRVALRQYRSFFQRLLSL